jgi:Tfp pilus assembly protein PilP
MRNYGNGWLPWRLDAKAKIPPLPVVEAYEAVPYDVGNLLDPFKPAKMAPDEKKGGGGFRPDLDRPKEPLELYPLESLKYVGVMTRQKVSYAIVQVGRYFAPNQDRKLHGAELRRGGERVRVGDHLARTHPGFGG